MVFKPGLTLDEMLKIVGCEELTSGYHMNKIIPEKHGSDWGGVLWRESKELNSWLMDTLELNPDRDHSGNGYAVSLALDNSFKRGNKNNKSAPVTIEIFEGLEGAVLRITDSGPGFNYIGIYNKMINRDPWWTDDGKSKGDGFRYLQAASFQVWYEGAGNIINICIRNEDRDKGIIYPGRLLGKTPQS